MVSGGAPHNTNHHQGQHNFWSPTVAENVNRHLQGLAELDAGAEDGVGHDQDQGGGAVVAGAPVVSSELMQMIADFLDEEPMQAGHQAAPAAAQQQQAGAGAGAPVVHNDLLEMLVDFLGEDPTQAGH
jgi:hypothetical protein